MKPGEAAPSVCEWSLISPRIVPILTSYHRHSCLSPERVTSHFHVWAIQTARFKGHSAEGPPHYQIAPPPTSS
jgi:hypothetical protein